MAASRWSRIACSGGHRAQAVVRRGSEQSSEPDRPASEQRWKWAEQRRDNTIDAAAASSSHIMEAADSEALHAHTTGEPLSIVRGSWSKGLVAWRKLKNRFDPET